MMLRFSLLPAGCLVGGLLSMGCLPATLQGADTASSSVPAGYRLVYSPKLDGPEALAEFALTDRTAWQIAEDGSLELVKQSQYEPKVRSPLNIALVDGRTFGDFVLECDMLQTGREYGHRDMCLFFGVQDPSHFYYAHIATKTDDHAHNIFIVNDEPRTKISDVTTDGVDWGLERWHHVRLERSASTGVIRVYFDDMDQPIMTAEDRTFGPGFVGFGSFDDTGKVRNIRIWAQDSEKKEVGFYQKP